MLRSTNTYFELKVKPSAGLLYQSASLGTMPYRIVKADWLANGELTAPLQVALPGNPVLDEQY